MTTPTPAPVPDVPSVDVAGALRLLSDGAALVDVREQNEWDAGHAPQAVHAPLARLAAEPGLLPEARPVVVVCRSGRRSAFAVAQLLSLGIDALNLAGGMQAWQREAAEVVSDSGSAPAVI